MRLTLKAKLGATFATVVALSGISMFIAIQNLGSLNDQLNAIVNGNVQRVRIANEINAHTLRIGRDEKNFILVNSEEEMNKFDQAIKGEMAAITEKTAKLRELSSDEVGKPKVDAFTAAWNNFLVKHEEVKKLARGNSAAIAFDQVQKAREARATMNQSLTKMLERLRGEITTNPSAQQAYEGGLNLERTAASIAIDLRNVIIADGDIEAQKAFDQAMQERVKTMQDMLGTVGTVVPVTDREAYQGYRAQAEDWLKKADETRATALINSDFNAFQLANGAGKEARQASIDALNAVIDLNNQQMVKASADTDVQYADSRNLLLALLAGSTLIAVMAAGWIVFSISRALSSALGLANAVADGDLSAEAHVKSNDEIKDLLDALNRMVAKLKEVVGEVSTATRNVASGSQELSAIVRTAQPGCDRAGFVDRGSLRVDGRDGRQHQAECRERRADGKDRPSVGARRPGLRRCRRQGRQRDADHRREDPDRAGNRSPDRPARPQRRGGSGTGRRTWPRLCGGGLGSAQAGRTQPGGSRRKSPACPARP